MSDESPMLTVRDFGAVGDGETDDTDAILAAFAAGVRVFPPGRYRFNAPLVLNDDEEQV